MEKFAIGVLLGGLGGALLVANNYKMRTLVKKSQQEVQNKINDLMDEKLRAMEIADDADESQEKSETAEDKSKKKSKK